MPQGSHTSPELETEIELPLIESETITSAIRSSVSPVLDTEKDNSSFRSIGFESKEQYISLLHQKAAVTQAITTRLHGVLPESHPVCQYINQIFDEIDIPENDRCKIVIYKDDANPEACVYLDGRIFISTGILKRIPRYKEVWQALLAHEQLHYSEKHTLNRVEAELTTEESELHTRGLAHTRINETLADIRGSIGFLDKSGINPLGAKVLNQYFSTIDTHGYSNASHGSGIDRVLNDETVFGLYDMRSLSTTLTPLEIEDDTLDSIPNMDNHSMRIGSKREEFAKSLSLEQSILWAKRFVEDEKSGRIYNPALEICRLNIMAFLSQPPFELDQLEKEALMGLLLGRDYRNKSSSNGLNRCNLDSLEKILSPSVWDALPKGIYAYDVHYILNTVRQGFKEGFTNYGLDPKGRDELLDKWSHILIEHFRALGIMQYSKVILKELLINFFKSFQLDSSPEIEMDLARLNEANDSYRNRLNASLEAERMPTSIALNSKEVRIIKNFFAIHGENSLEIISEARRKKFDETVLNYHQPSMERRAQETVKIDYTDNLFYGSVFELYYRYQVKLNKTDSDLYKFASMCEVINADNNWALEKNNVKKDNRRYKTDPSKYCKNNYHPDGMGQSILSLKYGHDFFSIGDKIIKSISPSMTPSEFSNFISTLLEAREAAAHYRFGIHMWHTDSSHVYKLIGSSYIAYLNLFTGNKAKLMETWHETKHLQKYITNPQSQIELYLLQSSIISDLDWDLSNSDECLFLLDIANYINDLHLRSGLTTMLVARYLEMATFEQKIEYLFGSSSSMVKDMVLQRDFVESEVKTHGQILAVRSKIESLLEDQISDPSSGIALAALGDCLGTGDALGKMELLLGVGKDDRDLKEMTFELSIKTNEDSDNRRHAYQAVTKAEQTINTLLNMSAGARFFIVRHLLVKGYKSILHDTTSKKRLFELLLSNTLSKKKSQKAVKAVIQEVLDIIAEIPEWEELYFAILPVLKDNILLRPKKSIPWSDIYAVEASLGSPYSSKTHKKEAKFNPSKCTESQAKNHLSLTVGNFLKSEYDFTTSREKMSPIDLIVTVAKQLGSPAVRFLQVMGQYVDIPSEYNEAFSKVYDDVAGQNKLFADALLEREWPDYREAVKGLNFTAGGGSIMTVFGTDEPDAKGDVLKVRNPNIQYRMELAFGFMEKIVGGLTKKDPEKYGALPFAISDIKEWIMHDIKDEDFLEKDVEFRNKHDGFEVNDNPYTLRIPETKGPHSEYFKREAYVSGRNLTSWNTLESEGHDMKAVVSLVAKNYLAQLTQPVNEKGAYRLHADIHPGNLRLDDDGNVWILDRNGYHDYNEHDVRLFMSIQISKSLNEVKDALVAYFGHSNDSNIVRKVLDESLGDIKEFSPNAIRLIISKLRLNGVDVPLRITILLKNLNALNRFALKAGFKNGLTEALSH